MRRAALAAVCLLLCVLSAAGCADGKNKPIYTPGTVAPKPVVQETVPLPDDYVRYTVENFGLSAPGTFFRFTSGDPKNLLALTDERAQIYVRKCVPSDTGTDESYFAGLDAYEYCELFCDLSGISGREPLTAYQVKTAGVRYVVPADNDETTAVHSLYFVKDADHGCVWLVRCRCTKDVLGDYEDLFEDLTYFFGTAAE